MPPNTTSSLIDAGSTNAFGTTFGTKQGRNDAEFHLNRDEKKQDEWTCLASLKSMRTINPIRAIVDPIVANSVQSGEVRGDGKDQISLALGDPTVYDNLEPCPVLMRAAARCASARTNAGYVNACGSPEARAAIAKYYSTPEAALSPDDVVLASGCSGALELALTALLDEGSVLLVPRPGFPLYQVIAESHGAQVQHYDLDPKKNWECDLEHLESLVRQHRDTVRGIVITNPSNPCGSVFSEKHLRELIRFAAQYQLPIVSDEVYGDMTFGSARFHPLGHVAAKMGKSAPVIAASGLGKQFLVPGWRVGWLTFHDSSGEALQDIKKGVVRLAQVILGASHLAQGTIPSVLDPQSQEDACEIVRWKTNLNATLATQSEFTCDELRKCNGLTVVPSMGAMYVMVAIDPEKFDEKIEDDLDFTRLLLQEENVFALPGSAFGAPNFFRVVYCASCTVLQQAFDRIEEFCLRHAK